MGCCVRRWRFATATMPAGSVLHNLGLETLSTSRQRALPSSLYEVQCAPGYRCVSRVKDFGRGHDDAYRFIPEYERSKENAPDDMYELGCPAKGVMSEMGECKKGTADDTGLCYSS